MIECKIALAILAIGQTAVAAQPDNCQGTNVQASAIALRFDRLKETEINRVEEAVSAMKGVMRASMDEDSLLMTVLVDANGAVTAEKLVEYVKLAGYQARKASDEELEQALDAMRAEGAVVIRREIDNPEEADATLPETPAGRAAKAFLEAFNSGNDERMRMYSKSHRSATSLEERPMDERLEQYRSFYRDWGKLDLWKVESHDEHHATITVKPERGFSGLSMTFECAAKPPHKLDEIRVMPTFIEDPEADEGGPEGLFGEVTILTDSLEPLQIHFNTNKDKHRFVAILSPT